MCGKTVASLKYLSGQAATALRLDEFSSKDQLKQSVKTWPFNFTAQTESEGRDLENIKWLFAGWKGAWNLKLLCHKNKKLNNGSQMTSCVLSSSCFCHFQHTSHSKKHNDTNPDFSTQMMLEKSESIRSCQNQNCLREQKLTTVVPFTDTSLGLVSSASCTSLFWSDV